MGVPKRKAPGGRAGPAKRARQEEFTGVRFKAQLKDPQAVAAGACGAVGVGPGARVHPAICAPLQLLRVAEGLSQCPRGMPASQAAA